MAVDIIARGLGASAGAAADLANSRLDSLSSSLVYRGAVDYYSDLSGITSPEPGDAYTVKYKGTSGTTPDGTEYAWGEYEGTPQWIAIGPDMSQYQPVLVSGTNIKTINNQSILGSGNMDIATNQAFPTGWPTTSATTTKAFCDAVNADSSAVAGMSYLGEVRWSDLPSTLVNAEVVVEIMHGTGTSGKVIHLVLTSGNLAPYRWEYTYWNNGSNVSGWIGYQTQLTAGEGIAINGNTISANVRDIEYISTSRTYAEVNAIFAAGKFPVYTGVLDPLAQDQKDIILYPTLGVTDDSVAFYGIVDSESVSIQVDANNGWSNLKRVPIENNVKILSYGTDTINGQTFMQDIMAKKTYAVNDLSTGEVAYYSSYHSTDNRLRFVCVKDDLSSIVVFSYKLNDIDPWSRLEIPLEASYVVRRNSTTWDELMGAIYVHQVPYSFVGTQGFYLSDYNGTDSATFTAFDGSYFTVTYDSDAGTTTYGNIVTNVVRPTVIDTTYADLVAAQSGSTLVEGAFYRITDYVTKINGTYDISSMAGSAAYVHYAKSAEHPFDLIVQALDESTLSENASAIQHAGDTYFANSDLSSWQLKYTIENDPIKYSWADATNGKGVIYYMKDEFGNECHYDFKNIQYIAYAITYTDAQYEDDLCYDASTQPKRYGSVYYVFQALSDYLQSGTYASPFPDTWYKDFSVGANILGTIQFPTVDAAYLSTFNADWYYTFDEYNTSTGEHQDKTLNSSGLVVTYDNVIGRAPDALSVTLSLQNIPEGLPVNIFEYLTGGDEWCWANNFGDNSLLNIFSNTQQVTTGAQFSFNITSATFVCNIFGNYCYSNSFSHQCNDNSFGNNCQYNSFGNNCTNNSFGNECTANSFGYSCTYNSFDNGCGANSFGNGCHSNSFGNNCTSNSFSDGCFSNSFGNYCKYNIFGDYCTYNTVFEYVYCIEIVNNTSPKLEIGRYTVLSGRYGTDFLHKYQLTISTPLQNYPMYVGFDTSGSVRTWNPADAAVLVSQGMAQAGKFMVVGNDGMVTPTAVPQWQGTSY